MNLLRMSKKTIGGLKRVLIWSVVILFSIEAVSFIILHGAHVVVYGRLRDYNYVFYDPYTVFQSRGGLRNTINPGPGPVQKKQTHVWLFGGSTMHGYTKHDERTIPSYLSAQLNSRTNGTHYVLKNFGEPAFNSLLEVKYFQKAMIEEEPKPDLVIFYDGANDSIFLSQYREPNGHYGMRRMKALIENYRDSFLGLLKPINAYYRSSFTKELWDKINQVLVPIRPDDTLLGDYLSELKMRYGYLARTCHAHNIDFVVVWQPIKWSQQCNKEHRVKDSVLEDIGKFTAMSHNYSLIYDRVTADLAPLPYFHDLSQAGCDGPDEFYQADGVHLTDEGRAAMADHLETKLKDYFY
ncbi:MAG: SGNH/GDSL hydrolase family protein [Desulfobulbaceae bacterium]|nr:MAG: SGNH/GDSL hydrolase family protein [Desulfobulbaceae bacterium]